MKLMNFLEENQWIELTLMQIWKAVWLNHSQKVLNKLNSLEKKWLITKTWKQYLIHKNCKFCNAPILSAQDKEKIFNEWIKEGIRISLNKLNELNI